MKKRIMTVALLALMLASARGARADARQGPGEGSLAVQQALASLGTSFGGLLLTGATAEVPPVAAGSALMTPYGVGMAVCGLGKRSRQYEGSCGAAIGGAYLGALSTLPLAIIGHRLAVGGGSDEHFEGLFGAFAGMAVGWLVVQPLLANVMWHASKRPRLEAAVPVSLVPRARLRAPESASRSQMRGRAPGQMTLTLLSAGF